jgi:hypothetical protein
MRDVEMLAEPLTVASPALPVGSIIVAAASVFG